LVIKPLEEDHTPGTVKPFQVSLVEPVACPLSHSRSGQIAAHPALRSRHTAATLALGAGVPAKVVSEQLAHASVAFTLDTYSHVLPHMQESAAAQVEALLFDSTPKKRAARKTKRATRHRTKSEHKINASSK
jgi:hypothetical protein